MSQVHILISAYACEPDRGSEPGVGWKWALWLSLNPNYKVHVITRANNRTVIENYCKERNINNISFFYYDLPYFFLWLKRHGFSVNLYYSLWQIGIIKLAKNLHKSNHYDVVHHLTFGVYRDVSFLYKLKPPFIFGPVGGGDYTPPSLVTYGKKYQFKEKVRECANVIALFNPFIHKMFASSALILTKTEATRKLVPSKWHYKTYNRLEIGIDHVTECKPENRNKNTFLYVGRFLYWKGIDLLMNSFKYYLEHYDSSTQLLLIGEGEYKTKIERFIDQNSIQKNVKLIPWLNYEELKSYYSISSAFIFPSLHDSSGNVVLEALSFGLPVICLNCGGPACVMGDNLKETVISTHNRTAKEVEWNIAEKMHQLVSDEIFYNMIANKSIQRAQELLWDRTVNDTYNFIFSKI